MITNLSKSAQLHKELMNYYKAVEVLQDPKFDKLSICVTHKDNEPGPANVMNITDLLTKEQNHILALQIQVYVIENLRNTEKELRLTKVFKDAE